MSLIRHQNDSEIDEASDVSISGVTRSLVALLRIAGRDARSGRDLRDCRRRIALLVEELSADFEDAFAGGQAIGQDVRLHSAAGAGGLPGLQERFVVDELGC